MAAKITLKPNPDNPRTISDSAFKKLKDKIKRNPDGLTANKIVHKDGIIIAGNQRWRALQELKLELKEDWFKDVSSWTDEQVREYLITSNISDGEWDFDILANEWNADELEEWGLDLPASFNQGEVEEDEAPEVSSEPPVSQLGSIYQLGKHRVMCGDSTVKENVEQLMNGVKADMVFTDPPYGMNYDTKMSDTVRPKGEWSNKVKNYSDVIGDDTDFDPQPIFDMFGYCKEMILWGADYYAERLVDKNKGSWFVWDKRAGVEKLEWTTSEYELCWSKARHHRQIARIKWHGLLGMEQEFDGKDGRLHPTQKPSELARWFINKFSKKDQNIIDLFLGSGSTLIACEQTDRTCYGMELDEKYLDVIRKRWAKYVYPDRWEKEWEILTPAIEKL